MSRNKLGNHMGRVLIACITLMTCAILVAACAASPGPVNGYSDCAAWTKDQWQRADDELRKDAALAFMVEYSGSTDETYRKLTENLTDGDLSQQRIVMQEIMGAWFEQAGDTDTMADLMAEMQETAGEEQVNADN